MTEARTRTARWLVFAAALLALAGVFAGMVVDMRPRRRLAEVPDYRPWPRETVRLAETLPVQDGGRVKPLSTLAGFTMLRLHGARTMKIAGEGGRTVRIGPTEWLLDCLFRPGLAVRLPTFRIDDSRALEAIGVAARRKRDRHSYQELEPARDRLLELAASCEQLPAAQRSPGQRQLLTLAYNLRSFEGLTGYFTFARNGIEAPPQQPGGAPARTELSAVLATAPALRAAITKAEGNPDAVPADVRVLVDQVLAQADMAGYGLAPLPPPAPGEPWRSAGARAIEVLRGHAPDTERALDDLRALERLGRAPDAGEPQFAAELAAFKQRVEARTHARGEGRTIALEASYYRANWFFRASICFLATIVVGLAMWLAAGTRAAGWLARGVALGTLAGFGLAAAGIAQRSLIMGRPPVGNLYDTVPFITTAAVAVALVVELVTRRRFALAIAPVLGLVGLTLARRFEVGDATDHMDPLVAVLNSNLWLTVHVITITLGYSAGLLAAAFSHCYLLMRGLGLDRGDAGFRRSLTRATYGVICLTLLLSLLGTVLGGIWANYSWGRFWGWDPKENGALMIVLCYLAILHARLANLLNEWLFHLASVCGACVVAFSWWHVNFLGVGLHNYGFTAGKAWIRGFYAAEAAVIAAGLLAWAISSARSRSTPATPV